MAKTKTQKYLVVVVPGRPVAPVGVGTSGVTFSATPPTTVRTVEATSAKDAAEKVGVAAGATAHVAQVAYVSKFKRPAKADLEAA